MAFNECLEKMCQGYTAHMIVNNVKNPDWIVVVARGPAATQAVAVAVEQALEALEKT